MQAIEIIVIIASVLIVLGVIAMVIVNKKKGKCSFSCSDCPNRNICKDIKKNKNGINN